jgi:hypothetical protein
MPEDRCDMGDGEALNAYERRKLKCHAELYRSGVSVGPSILGPCLRSDVSRAAIRDILVRRRFASAIRNTRLLVEQRRHADASEATREEAVRESV